MDRHDKHPIANPDSYDFGTRNTLYLFQFGAYGSTLVYAWSESGGLESALECAAEWLIDNAPGHIDTHESQATIDRIEDAREELRDGLGREPTDNELWEHAEADMTHTASGWLVSHEWYVREVDDSDEVAAVMRRCVDKEHRDDAHAYIGDHMTIADDAPVEHRDDGSVWVQAWVRVVESAAYTLTLDPGDVETLDFVGGRYGWTSIRHYIEDDRHVRMAEFEAWEWREACEADDALFPMLAPDCSLYRRLSALLDSIV